MRTHKMYCFILGFCKHRNGDELIFFIYYRGQSWRSGTMCDCKTDWLWVRPPLEVMKYFPFLRSGVEFCHSSRKASRIR